jgi:hypothetical protein
MALWIFSTILFTIEEGCCWELVWSCFSSLETETGIKMLQLYTIIQVRIAGGLDHGEGALTLEE